MKSSIINMISLIFGVFFLTGCATRVTYNPDDFVNPNRVIEKRIHVSGVPTPKVKATYGIGNDPLVVKAYQRYTRTGKLETIRTPGWITYPYNQNTKPIMKCQPLRLCVVQLETGETLNSVNLGNSQDWKVGEFLTGAGKDATISVTIKPTQYDIATDLIISTNKRTYNIGLVSKRGVNVSVLRFYYPQETRIASILNAQRQMKAAVHSTKAISTTQLTDGTKINLKKVSFNYRIKGNNPPWRPLRVFDDTNKTYIEMPAISSRFNLPVLYLARNKKLQMVNYRYEKPYFVIDGLFGRAWLVSGKGQSQERVEIINQNIKS